MLLRIKIFVKALIYVLVDFFAITFAFSLPYYWRYHTTFFQWIIATSPFQFDESHGLIFLYVFWLAVLVLLLHSRQLYQTRRDIYPLAEIVQIQQQYGQGSTVALCLLHGLAKLHVQRGAIG